MSGSILKILNRSPSPVFTRCLFLSVTLILLLTLLAAPLAAEQSAKAVVLEIKGAISPAVSDYLQQGMAKAAADNADLLIFQMDTPGGLDLSMRDIIRMILASSVPVVSYVAPDGARAASAGTYILYASHIAAMAPATNLGAATPISIGGLPGSPAPKEKEQRPDDALATDDGSTLKRKVINDASAYIKALAERNGRNAEWAVKAVQEAVSLTASEALKLHVIDFIAADLQDLLGQLDGHYVRVHSEPRLLSTKDMTLTTIKPTWRYKLLSVISDPNVAYFLLLLGFYGLIYELANPGVLLPGVAGGISLLLAFYAFQILPINYSGLALMTLGIVLLISEAFLPSFGALGIGGIVSFAIGSLILMDDQNLRVSIPLIIGTTAVSAVFLLVLAGRVLFMRKMKIRTGAEALIGMVGNASQDFEGEGRIWLLGESWLAESPKRIKKGERVRVVSRNGLKLTVQSLKEGP